jgi:1-deoxy-D-xylulose-5-phosphate reductoisomerase
LKKQVAILGSTGSIGTQALDVVRSHPGLFGVEVLTAQSNCDLLILQAIEFRPNAVVIGDGSCYAKVADGLKDYPVKVFAGEEAIAQIVEMEDISLVLNALVGYSGMIPALRAVSAGKDLALANKESLVIAGEMIMAASRQTGAMVIPVDSEHSAIFQCLAGERHSSVEKIYLTASGGPFRGHRKEHLEHIGKESALRHPNWKMGSKITIDSATLMNKGLEVIEARWLFDLAPAQIDVVIHPQSVIHSVVQFCDGSMKAQMGLPDMKLPILYALGYPHRIQSDLPRFDFAKYPSLTFEEPDREVFRNLGFAYLALEKGGNMPCILNAANEAAVQAFLNDRIGFLEISRVIEQCMVKVPYIGNPGLADYIMTHKETLITAEELIGKKEKSKH